MRVLFVAEAAAEAIAARRCYDRQAPGLGTEFVRALDAAIAAITRSPHAFTPVDECCRRALLRRFPFSVVYRADETAILVIAVFHHRRQPRAWVERPVE